MSLPVVMGLIAVFWIVLFGFYIYTSRKQTDLARDLEQVRRQVDRLEREG